MIKKRTILIILLIILFIGASLAIYFLTKENEELNITGTVLISGDGYIMIETENEDYIINNISNIYEIGDEITVTYKRSSLKDSTNPKEISAIKETLIKKNKPEEELEENNTTNTSENIINGNQGKNTNLNETNGKTNTNNSPNKNHTSNNNTNKTPTNNNSNNNVTSKSADEAVLEYVNTIQSDADKGITDTLKSGFITVVDFLFYNGKIAGHTFNELTTSAKLEVLKAALWIDDKIDNVFPGYKETISNGANKVYTSIKNLIVNTYLDITSNICENHDDLCTSAKEGFQDLKESFGLTWEFLKDLASSGLNKLKNWYETWSGK
ncbi:unknown [Mycoplasma sp. CAG:776]|nr:unknown [Mycoplasma sp. CAG:776]